VDCSSRSGRPYTFIVLAVLILVLSPVMISRTPTDIFPNIDIPVIAVAWQYTGMNPEELEGWFVYARHLAFALSRLAPCGVNLDNGLTIYRGSDPKVVQCVDSPRSISVRTAVIRPLIPPDSYRLYCHATAITGMSMFGKISVGVREIITGLRTKMSTARTMNVYGRSRATRTIHISRAPYIPIAN